MSWKRWLAGASLHAIAAAIATGGVAADAQADDGPMRPAGYDWSGFYVGAHVGYGEITSDGFFATSVDFSIGGGQFLGGGQVGWNWQHAGWVLGIEGDISGLNWQDANIREEQYIAKATYLTTLRGRVGWSERNVLFYLTGGLAYLQGSVTTSEGGRDADQQGNTDGKDYSAVGGVAGVGLEWALTRNLSMRAEGLHLFFDHSTSLFNLKEGCKPGFPDCLNTLANFFSVGDGFEFRLGADWRFGGGANDPASFGALGALPRASGPYNWNGFYLGLNTGLAEVYAGGMFDNTRRIPDTGKPAFVNLKDFENRGLVGGGQAGYNWQTGWLVLGIEGDIAGYDGGDLFVDRQVPEVPIAAALDLNMFATLRGRLGYAANNWLFYGTGGVAFLDGDFKNVSVSSGTGISATGAAVGGGVEWGITPNLSVKGEGLFLTFDDSFGLAKVKGGVPGDRLTLDDGLLWRIGANWRFAPYMAAGEMGSTRLTATSLSPAYDWRGTYIGAQIGDGGLRTEGVYNPFNIPSQTIALTNVGKVGVVGGGQIGSNWQTGSIVYGVEGDIVALNWDGSQGEFAHPAQGIKFNTNSLTTARARVGWAPDNLLFFATAGLAYLDARLDNTSNNGGRTKSVDTFGGVAGLGMEWGVSSRLSVKVEGDYLFFNSDTGITNIGSEGDPGDFFRIDDGFVARLGVNWRVGPVL